MGNERSKTALITGASSGIGRELARCLAMDGVHLVLVARNRGALKEIAAECRQRYNVKAWVIEKDLTKAGAAQDVFEELAKHHLSLDILVNNAGFGIWGDFENSPLDMNHQAIQLQIVNMLEMVKLALPMLKQHGGDILNVGSVYSVVPVPFQSIYAAAKAFILSFSLSLREELKESGINVTILCPGSTKTNFHKQGVVDKKMIFKMEAKDVAEIGYRGMLNKKAVVVPGAINKAFVCITRMMPLGLIGRIVRWAVYSVRKLEIPSNTASTNDIHK